MVAEDNATQVHLLRKLQTLCGKLERGEIVIQKFTLGTLDDENDQPRQQVSVVVAERRKRSWYKIGKDALNEN